MIPLSRKRLIVIVGVIVAVLFVIATVLVLTRSNQDLGPDSDASGAQVEPTYFTVNITNLSENRGNFPMKDTYSIWSSMWQTVNKNVGQQEDYYSGNIRDGSVKKYNAADGVPIVEMLVDLPEVQRTFKLTIEGDENTGYQAAFVTCPSPTELVYPPTTCVGQDADS